MKNKKAKLKISHYGILKDRKGSHVGLILSFVVFITFSFFVLSVLNPALKQREDKQLELDLLKQNLFERINSNLSVTSLKIKNETASFSCFKINNFLSSENELETKVKDESNNLVGFTIPEGEIKIMSTQTFFKIYHSKNFLVGEDKVTRDECNLLNPENYTLGSTRIDQYIFEGNILDLLNEYDTNYTLIKTELGISEINQFGISFTNSTNNEIQKGFQQVSGNIYIEDIPIQYYNSEADIKTGSIKIRIW